MGVRDTAAMLLAAADRAADTAGGARWLTRAFLEYGFLDDRGAQAAIAVRMAGLARDGFGSASFVPGVQVRAAEFQAAAVDGLVASYAGDDRGTFRLMAATSLFETSGLDADLLCAELYGESTLETGECIAARDRVESVLVGGGGGKADRHRLYVLLARIELVLARPVPAASALHAASLLSVGVDPERARSVEEHLAALVGTSTGSGLTGEELEVAAALARSASVTAAAAELHWSVRDVEFFRASARAKLDAGGRHRRAS